MTKTVMGMVEGLQDALQSMDIDISLMQSTLTATKTKADSAVQPESLAAVATSGNYDSLNNRPTLGTAAAQNANAFATAAQGIKADAALPSSRVTISTADPSGGVDGDIWFKVT